jgi:tetratricopeptide (TPR) repeat protein
MDKTGLILGLLLMFIGCKSISEKSTQPTGENKAIQQYHEALRNYFKEDYAKSLECLDKVLAVNPRNDAALYLKSKIYFDQENWSEASNFLKKAAEADPLNRYIQEEVAYMYSAMGNFNEAGARYVRMIERFPGEQTYYSSGFVNFLQAKNYSAANKILDREKSKLGCNADWFLKKFNVFIGMGKKEQAEVVLTNGLAQFPGQIQLLRALINFYTEALQQEKADRLLKQICASDPNNGEVKSQYAQLLYANGNKIEADSLWVECLSLRDFSLEKKAEILLRRNKAFGCTTSTINTTSRFMKENPSLFIAHTLSGDLEVLCKNNISAIEHYSNALKINPQAYPVWITVLEMYHQEENWDSLNLCSQRCLALFPSQPFPYLMQSRALLNMDLPDEAKVACDMGKDLLFDNPFLGNKFTVTDVLINVSKKDAKNIEIVLQPILKAPEISLNDRLDILNYLVNNAKAIEFAHKTVSDYLINDPNNFSFLALKARIFLINNETVFANECINKAVSLGYPERLALEFLGDIAQKEGDLVLAKKRWLEAQQKGNYTPRLNKKIIAP